MANVRFKFYSHSQDGNDQPPRFASDYIEVTIQETTPPGTIVETVFAQDDDPPSSPNGQVYYRINTGDEGRFVIDENSGVVRVAPGATFDYDVINQYRMTVSI